MTVTSLPLACRGAENGAPVSLIGELGDVVRRAGRNGPFVTGTFYCQSGEVQLLITAQACAASGLALLVDDEALQLDGQMSIDDEEGSPPVLVVHRVTALHNLEDEGRGSGVGR